MDNDDFQIGHLTVPPEHLYHLSDLINLEDLSDAAFRTLVYLYAQVWQQMGDWLLFESLSELAEARGVEVDTIQNHLAALEGQGLIEISDAGGFAPGYSRVLILAPKNQRGPTILLGQAIHIWIDEGRVTAPVKDYHEA